MSQLAEKIKESGYAESWPPVKQLSFILEKFAEWFPFENVDVLTGNEEIITPEFLTKKMVQTQRGGLCYETNALLLLVLQEFGFDAELGAATVNNDGKWALEHTHALVLLQLNDGKYIADSGFGNRLALSPLKLDGPEVISPAGTFRLRTRRTEKGTIAAECQNSQGDWYLCYAFDWQAAPWEKLSEMKQLIHAHPHSPFNKQLLIARASTSGTESINEARQHRKWQNGTEETFSFEDKHDFLQAIRGSCSPALTKAIEAYKARQSSDQDKS